MPSPFYPASIVLFQLHGGMISHMNREHEHEAAAFFFLFLLTTYVNTYIDIYGHQDSYPYFTCVHGITDDKYQVPMN